MSLRSLACQEAGLVTQGLARIGAMDRLMAAGAPARAVLKARAVVFGACRAGEQNVALARGVLRDLQVAAQTKVGVASDEHLGVHRSVRTVAGGAAFLHRVMLEDKWTLLRRMALRAGFRFRFKRRAGAFDGIAGMRIMAIGATHVAVQDLMTIRQAE